MRGLRVRALPSTGLGSVVTVTLGWVTTGSWDQTHVVGGSTGARGSKSLSQMLGRVSLRLARVSWLPQDRAGSRLSLSVDAAMVMVAWRSWPRDGSSLIDGGLRRGLASSARPGSSLPSREMWRDILARELIVAFL